MGIGNPNFRSEEQGPEKKSLAEKFRTALLKACDGGVVEEFDMQGFWETVDYEMGDGRWLGVERQIAKPEVVKRESVDPYEIGAVGKVRIWVQSPEKKENSKITIYYLYPDGSIKKKFETESEDLSIQDADIKKILDFSAGIIDLTHEQVLEVKERIASEPERQSVIKKAEEDFGLDQVDNDELLGVINLLDEAASGKFKKYPEA